VTSITHECDRKGGGGCWFSGLLNIGGGRQAARPVPATGISYSFFPNERTYKTMSLSTNNNILFYHIDILYDMARNICTGHHFAIVTRLTLVLSSIARQLFPIARWRQLDMTWTHRWL
jgi:hypothetical protein